MVARAAEPAAVKKCPWRRNEISPTALSLQVQSLRYPVEAKARKPRQYPPRCWRGFQFQGTKWQPTERAANGRRDEEERLPISALLERIRRLVPRSGDKHYDEIVRNFGVGTLRPPPTPMSDGELARAIAEFLKEQPSSESVAALGRRLDPSSRL